MILLVEDEAITRTSFAEILRGHGYEVIESGDGVEALALVAKHRQIIDLVITDMVMPGMNGITLFPNLKLLMPKVPIIMMSGYMSKRGGEAILGNEAKFLEKPIKPEVLLGIVQYFLPTRLDS